MFYNNIIEIVQNKNRYKHNVINAVVGVEQKENAILFIVRRNPVGRYTIIVRSPVAHTAVPAVAPVAVLRGGAMETARFNRYARHPR